MDFSGQSTSPDYEELADELEAVAQSIRQNPTVNHNLAERLSYLATQLREDIRTREPKKKAV